MYRYTGIVCIKSSRVRIKQMSNQPIIFQQIADYVWITLIVATQYRQPRFTTNVVDYYTKLLPDCSITIIDRFSYKILKIL